MYRSYNRSGGMGAIDWGGIINSGIQAGSNILSNVLGTPISSVNPAYTSNYPADYVQSTDEFNTADILGMVAIGAGAFLIIKAMTGKKRRR